MLRARILGVTLTLLTANACTSATEAPDPPEATGRVGDRISLMQQAYCSIQVSGSGAKETELDYLPHVIACENNGAGLEALKAQAVAARSTAYYEMANKGSICNGQGCQVYSCANKPTALHYQAVAETAQQYLSYAGMVTYGFYVAGDANVSGPNCEDVSGATTKYVTFNAGKTGTSVKQTKLGYVGPPGFGQNRGCLSQHGAKCLESTGQGYLSILRFYYGDDIEITTAPGSCKVPSSASPNGGAAGAGGNEDPGNGSPSEPPSSPSPAGGSCAGQCGSSLPVGDSPPCYCDDQCTGFGDCCSDFASACGQNPGNPPAPSPPEPGPAPGSGGSCGGLCGSPSPVPGSSPACYCDVSCVGFGDCCGDFQAMCLS